MPPRTVAAGVLALTLCGFTAACSSPEDEAQAASTPSSIVLKPGRPGEKAQTVAPENFTGSPTQDEWNEADVGFMSGMIRHHDQAVSMTGWVPDRAASKQVKALADRMHATQEAEIDLMSGWLTEHKQPVPALMHGSDGSGPRAPEGSHEHDLMPGMLSAAEMDALQAAGGAEFDRLFLKGMVKHHQGAIAMCSDIASTGADQGIQELAANIGVDQAAEIDRMKDLLADM